MRVRTCPTEQQMREFQAGELPEPYLIEIADHLEQCSECEALAQRLDVEPDPVVAAIRAPHETPLPRASFSAHPTPMAAPTNTEDTARFSFLDPPIEAGELGRIPNYRVLSLLGKGGMALVFHAEDLALKRSVALKVMNPQLTAEPGSRERFLREAQIMAAIKDDHVATVYQSGRHRDIVYMAMELLQGLSLPEWLEQSDRSDIAELLRVAEGIVRGLDAVHRHGLIHRDLKPGNIWIERPSGRVKILDFGLARMVQEEAPLTSPGMVLGTPSYMSPEQTRGDALDARSDLFSLGCVLYRLFGGRDPFRAPTAMAILWTLTSTVPPPLADLNPAIPASLSDLIMELLRKDPRDRPASAAIVLHRLRTIIADQAKRPRRLQPVGRLWKAAKRYSTLALRTIGHRWERVCLAAMVSGALVYWGAGWLYPPRRPDPIAKSAPPPAVQPATSSVYLTDLKPIAAENWPFVPPRFPPPPGHPTKDRGPDDTVRFQGELSPHGIFMHPPAPPHEGEPSSLSYRLDRKFGFFRAEVALNDGPRRSHAPIIFSVYGDGKLLWRSEPVLTQDDLQTVEVPVRDISVLKIEVTTDDFRAAHAVWLEPRVVH